MELTRLNIRADKVQQFNNKGVYEVEDLLRYMPKKYYDFRHPKKFENIEDGSLSLVIMTIRSVEEKYSQNTNKEYIYMSGRDDDGFFYSVFYFNSSFMKNKLIEGERVAICGRANVENRNGKRLISFVNPMVTEKDIGKAMKIKPVYKKITGMSDDYLLKSINNALALGDTSIFSDYLELSVREKFSLLNTKETLFAIHQPKDIESIKQSKKRITFDDLFLFNFMLKRKSVLKNNNSKFKLNSGKLTNAFYKSLPYSLTNGQKEAISKLYNKGRNGVRVDALVQGDVGCGKTTVAEMIMLTAIDGGGQAVLLAPTVVLAKQHYEEIKKIADNIGFNVAFLSSDIKKSERKSILKKLSNNEIDILVGTHSVLSDDVILPKLSLAVIDEEHRFGVKQREKITEKIKDGVHSISMSATPIPRSLALSMYDDSIDIIEIKELPKGRKPVVTKIIENSAVAMNSLLKVVKAGTQAYVVCPMIDEDEESDIEDVNTTLKNFTNYYEPYGIKVGMVNGKMKSEDVAKTLDDFYQNKIQILISTTVIEVGVNVPNANVIWIKNAERFGLAQLHQLRGRVGRSDKQAICLIEGDMVGEKSRQKLETFCSSNDGFYLAQKDLEFRGAGDFIGTVQSGDNKYISLMLSYPDFNKKIKEEINEIFKDQNRINFYEERLMKQIEDHTS